MGSVVSTLILIPAGKVMLEMFESVFKAEAFTLFLLLLCGCLGLGLGRVQFRKIAVGITGVLFVGLAISAGLSQLGWRADVHLLKFCKDFGLALFVYIVGFQVGPSFTQSLRREGFKLNLLAILVTVSGTLLVWGLGSLVGIPPQALLGILAGATTNTPSLASATDLLKDDSLVSLATQSYAACYPLGVVGLVLTLVVLKSFQEKAFTSPGEGAVCSPEGLCSLTLRLTNPNLSGLSLQNLPLLVPGKVTITRILKREQLLVAEPETILEENDVLLAVGHVGELEKLRLLVGESIDMDIRNLSAELSFEKVLVSNRRAVAKSLMQLNLRKKFGALVSRVHRGGVEFLPDASYRTQYGDVLSVVCPSSHRSALSLEFGNSRAALYSPHLVPIFLGLALGVALGSLPLSLPGLSGEFRLGLAGGPLIVSLIAGHFSVRGFRLGYVQPSAGLMLKELGIALFLGCVGLSSGAAFFKTIWTAEGLTWIAVGSAVTVLPILAVGFLSKVVLRSQIAKNGTGYFDAVSGLLAGSMTDPAALSFAQALSGNEAPAKSYSTVYPLVMLLRIVLVQVLWLLCTF